MRVLLGLLGLCIVACADHAAPKDEQQGTLIGPAGGHFEFSAGISLDVPPGALEAPARVSVEVAQPPEDLAEVPAGALLFYLRMQPEGLAFAIPLTLHVELSEDAQAQLGEGAELLAVFPPDVVETFDDPDSTPQSEIVPLDMPADPHQVHLPLRHFSSVASVAVNCGGAGSACPTLSDPGDGRSVTLRTWCISRQLLGALSDTIPLEEIALTPRASLDPHRLLSTPARDAFAQVLANMESNEQVQVNVSWRSLATQFVLWQAAQSGTQPYFTADIGRSPHGVGAALDLQPVAPADAEDKTAGGVCQLFVDECQEQKLVDAPTCLGDKMYPEAGPLLRQAGFRFHRTCNEAQPCCDPMHWDHVGDPNLSLRPAVVRSFQTIWNNNHPCKKIPEGEMGVVPVRVGSKTFDALAATPTGGFNPKFINKAKKCCGHELEREVCDCTIEAHWTSVIDGDVECSFVDGAYDATSRTNVQGTWEGHFIKDVSESGLRSPRDVFSSSISYSHTVSTTGVETLAGYGLCFRQKSAFRYDLSSSGRAYLRQVAVFDAQTRILRLFPEHIGVSFSSSSKAERRAERGQHQRERGRVHCRTNLHARRPCPNDDGRRQLRRRISMFETDHPRQRHVTTARLLPVSTPKGARPVQQILRAVLPLHAEVLRCQSARAPLRNSNLPLRRSRHALKTAGNPAGQLHGAVKHIQLACVSRSLRCCRRTSPRARSRSS